MRYKKTNSGTVSRQCCCYCCANVPSCCKLCQSHSACKSWSQNPPYTCSSCKSKLTISKMLRFLNHKVQKITPSHHSFLLIPRTPVVVGALVYKYIIFLRLWYFYFQFFQASPFLPEYNLEKNVTMIKRYLDTHQVITPPFLLPAHVLNTCYRETPDTAPGQLFSNNYGEDPGIY